eukprot:gene9135-10108_t
MLPRLGIVKLILLIVGLIAFVQIIVLNFSNLQSDDAAFKFRKSILSNRNVKLGQLVVDTEKQVDVYAAEKRENFQLIKPEIRESQEKEHPCTITHKDALSAISRAKTSQCKSDIAKIACLLNSDKLYFNNITRLCPVDRSLGRPAHSIGYGHEYGPPIKIVYILTVHGRAGRQLKRLFKAIYHPNHYYYFHVDSRSDYLYGEVEDIVKKFPNSAIAPWRMATIWGGASLLSMLLRCMEDVLNKKDWKWDFFINISESDYPVLTNTKLAKFLRGHRDENFLKPHGGPVERFIKKQGIDRTFYECDEHLWRIGGRNIPEAIDVDGGSDWIALNRDFCYYVVNSQDNLVLGLKHMFQYALLPAESFFHTVLRNSPHCKSFVKSNLRLTNWKRKLGCRCQHKHIVDWCGCSPNNFKPEDFPRLKSQTTNAFARKFEAIINQGVITMLNTWLYGEYPENMPGLHSYWENLYHEKYDEIQRYDVKMTFFQSLARIVTKQLSFSSKCLISQIWKSKEAHYYMHKDKLNGVLVKFDAKIVGMGGNRELATLETWTRRSNYTVLFNHNTTEPASRLKGLEIGTSWDQKERVFRNFAGMIGPLDTPTLVHRWRHGKAFYVRIIWTDPINVIAGIYQMKVEDNWVISYHKPTFKKPLRPGAWKVKLVHNDDTVLGETSFLVVPLAYSDGKAVGIEDVLAFNNGPRVGLYSSDHAIDFDQGANDTAGKVAEFSQYSYSTGSMLEQWIDLLVARYWTIKDTCSIKQLNGDCVDLRICEGKIWSSLSPDPKSDISSLINDHGIR